MERALIVRGMLDGQRLELDEPVAEVRGAVEVVVRAVPAGGAGALRDVFELIATLADGTRSKDAIDRHLAEERASWGTRESP